MLRENDSRRKSDKNPPRPQRTALRCVPTRQKTCVVGICTVLLTGCTSTPQVVRPEPRPADCPPGSLEAMKELEVPMGKEAGVTFPVEGSAKWVTVHESSPVLMVDPLGKLRGTLYGRLYIGAERIQGRFTEARMQGKTYPVCLELEEVYTARKDIGGPADSAVVISTQYVRAVKHFE